MPETCDPADPGCAKKQADAPSFCGVCGLSRENLWVETKLGSTTRPIIRLHLPPPAPTEDDADGARFSENPSLVTPSLSARNAMPAEPRMIGRYVIEAKLGSGGMGTVYLGRGSDGTQRAIKVLHEEFGMNPALRQRLEREAEVLLKLAGGRTPAIIEIDTQAPQPYFVMEYVPGLSLDKHILKNGPISGGLAWVVVDALVEALAHFHAAGVTHRDLKPANVIIGSDGVKVLDFGISRLAETASLTEIGSLIGTFVWSSPEQAQGGFVGPASDVFNLGMLLVYALTGRHPFGSGSRDALMYRIVHELPDLSGVPQRLAMIVERCLSKDPAKRPTANDLLTQIRMMSRSSNSSDSGAGRPRGGGNDVIAPTQTVLVDVQQVIASHAMPQSQRGRQTRLYVGLATVLAVAIAAVFGFLSMRNETKVLVSGETESVDGVGETDVEDLPAETTPEEAEEVDEFQEFEVLRFCELSDCNSDAFRKRRVIDLGTNPRWIKGVPCREGDNCTYDVRFGSGGDGGKPLEIVLQVEGDEVANDRVFEALKIVKRHLSEIGLQQRQIELYITAPYGSCGGAVPLNNDNSIRNAESSLEARADYLKFDIWIYLSECSNADLQYYRDELKQQREKDQWELLLPTGSWSLDLGWSVAKGKLLDEQKNLNASIITLPYEEWFDKRGEELLLVMVRALLTALGTADEGTDSIMSRTQGADFLRKEYFYSEADKALLKCVFWGPKAYC